MLLSLCNFIGGLALFIYGIQVMGEGLQQAAGERIKYVLKTLTKNPIMGVSIGAFITAVIQSSSATTVLTIGFVNAGLMDFTRSISIILGANIGTTITAQIVAFKLTYWALPIIGVGFIIYFLFNKKLYKSIGYSILGLGILFLGLSIMTNAVQPFAASPIAKNMFITYSSNAISALLIGIIATAIFQSSSATTGIIIALASVNLITLQGAIPMLLGCNIGTCVTALLASIGTSLNAKRTAIAHLLFNVIGVLLFMPFLNYYQQLISYTAINTTYPVNIARQIANAHSIFNILNTLILLPFLPYYAKLITKMLPGKTEQTVNVDSPETQFLDNKLLATPSIALEAAIKETTRTLRITQEMSNKAMTGFYTREAKNLQNIDYKETIVNQHRLAITEYLALLMEYPLSHKESTKIIDAGLIVKLTTL